MPTDKDHDEKPEVIEGSISDLMEQELEEIEDGEDGDPGAAVGGDQEEGEPDAGEPPARKWGGRFNSPEEMEAEFIRLSTTPQAQPEQPKAPVKEEIPDLTEADLNTLREQDDADGTSYTSEYLKRKMQGRNLSAHELAALRRIDNEKGTDLQGEYYDLRTDRRIAQQNAPLIRKSQEEAQRLFRERESRIDQSNTVEFGDRLNELEGFCAKPENVTQILQFSPIAHIIVSEHERGSQATAHKLLLREAAAMNAMKQQGKKKRSVPADAGGGSGPKKQKDSAETVEEAFAMAEQEQDE